MLLKRSMSVSCGWLCSPPLHVSFSNTSPSISAASYWVLHKAQGTRWYSQPQTHRHLAQTLPGKGVVFGTVKAALNNIFILINQMTVWCEKLCSGLVDLGELSLNWVISLSPTYCFSVFLLIVLDLGLSVRHWGSSRQTLMLLCDLMCK